MKLVAVLAVALTACSSSAMHEIGRSDGSNAAGDGSPARDGSPAGAGRLRISGNKLVDGHGTPVRLTGINWFGFENSTYVPHGLWVRSMDELLDVVVAAKLNVLRVPFSTQMFDAGSTPNGIDLNLNPDLAGKTALQILDTLIAKAGARGLRVILDRHRPDSAAQSPLWYTSAYSEDRWISDWKMLAQRYRDNPVVVAFDLHNEPHGQATWGDASLATDWKAAAERAGNAILSVDPDALFLVEGIELYQSISYWWGGNLRGAMTAPVQLSSPDHVIYSPHDYPASIYPQTWFSDPTYPSNLPALWDATWGSLAQTAPVLVGEFGTKLQTDVDRKWLATLTPYIAAKEMSFTFWCLNPDSGDTGGLLGDDWTTVNQDKLSYLTPILAPMLPVQ
jgi:endoglucanase